MSLSSGAAITGSTCACLLKAAGEESPRLRKESSSRRGCPHRKWKRTSSSMSTAPISSIPRIRAFGISSIPSYRFIPISIVRSPIIRGELYHLPFNLNTFKELWGVKTPEEAKAKIAEETAPYAGKQPHNLEEQALALVGPTIYRKLIKDYTEKQWGRPLRATSPLRSLSGSL
jgi:hypothetical protein